MTQRVSAADAPRWLVAALLLGTAVAEPALPPLAGGAANAALAAALSESIGRGGTSGDAAGRAKVAELLKAPPDLLQMARSMGLTAGASGPMAPPSAAPSCSKSASLINSAADLMQVMRQPEAQRRMVEMGKDERALSWVLERTRESLADPQRFFELLAHPSTSNLLAALRADAGLLPRATQCGAEEAEKGATGETKKREHEMGRRDDRPAGSSPGARGESGTSGAARMNGTAASPRNRTATARNSSSSTLRENVSSVS